MLQFIAQHQVGSTIVGFWLASNIAGAMPSPDATSGKGYKFIFTLMHGLVGSVPRLLATVYPASKIGTYLTNGGTNFTKP